MKVKVSYSLGRSQWTVQNVFEGIHKKLEENFKDKFIFSELPYTNEHGGTDSPHILKIVNPVTSRYLVLSYWDHPKTFAMRHLGWRPIFCEAVATSSGDTRDCPFPIEPLSYVAQDVDYDSWAKEKCPWDLKRNCKLLFRGLLQDQRLRLSQINPSVVTSEKLPKKEYFQELTENQVGLSLDGAAGICNRDMEILAAGSALIRTKIKQIFSEELVPNKHQIEVPFFDDATKQYEAIVETFERVKHDKDFLRRIAHEGHEWFLRNGTVQANIDLGFQFILRHPKIFEI